MEIKRKYIIDERNRTVAVQLDVKTFEKIEETLENYGLMRLMQEEDTDDEGLELDQAQAYYGALGKAE
jgi:RelB antitoxin of RelBE toxin-antitoxin system